MPFAGSTGTGEPTSKGRPPHASLEPLPIRRDAMRAAAVLSAIDLIGTEWRAYGRDTATGLDQFGFFAEIYTGATKRFRDFGKRFVDPAGRGLLPHVGAIVEALQTWRGLFPIHHNAAIAGDVLVFASPDISPSLTIGVIVSPVLTGPGALLITAPGPGVHETKFGAGSRLQSKFIAAAFTWRGLP